MNKWFKMAVLGAMVVVMAMLAGCGESAEERKIREQESLIQQQQMLLQQQAAMAPAAAGPVNIEVESGGSDMSGVIAGLAIGSMLSDGSRYNGHNGYNDSRYKTQKTKVVNNYYGVDPKTGKPVKMAAAPITPVKPTVAPVPVAAKPIAADLSKPTAPVVDPAAARQKMIADRKAAVEASKAKRESGGGFLGLSKGSTASKPSGGSRSSGSRRSGRR